MIDKYQAALQGVYGCDYITTTGAGVTPPAGFMWIAIEVLSACEFDFVVSPTGWSSLLSLTVNTPQLLRGRWTQVGLSAVPANPKIVCYRCPL